MGQSPKDAHRQRTGAALFKIFGGDAPDEVAQVRPKVIGFGLKIGPQFWIKSHGQGPGFWWWNIFHGRGQFLTRLYFLWQVP
jgi:hypothetical protein